MNMLQVARKLYWILTERVGLDPCKLILWLRGRPSNLRKLRRFRVAYRGTLGTTPGLHDRFAEGGMTDTKYFWQDLVVMRMVFVAWPPRHGDIGSRADGFASHLANFARSRCSMSARSRRRFPVSYSSRPT